MGFFSNLVAMAVLGPEGHKNLSYLEALGKANKRSQKEEKTKGKTPRKEEKK